MVTLFYIDRRLTSKLEPCSMSTGPVFHIIWNTVPTYMEQKSKNVVPV